MSETRPSVDALAYYLAAQDCAAKGDGDGLAYAERRCREARAECERTGDNTPDNWLPLPTDRGERHDRSCRCDRCWADARDGYGP